MIPYPSYLKLNISAEQASLPMHCWAPAPRKKLFARFSPTELRRPKNSVSGQWTWTSQIQNAHGTIIIILYLADTGMELPVFLVVRGVTGRAESAVILSKIGRLYFVRNCQGRKQLFMSCRSYADLLISFPKRISRIRCHVGPQDTCHKANCLEYYCSANIALELMKDSTNHQLPLIDYSLHS